MTFTEGQRADWQAYEADWQAYERVRKGGQFNMWDPRARQATKLSPERYAFVIKHYSDLKAAVEAVSKGGGNHE